MTIYWLARVSRQQLSSLIVSLGLVVWTAVAAAAEEAAITAERCAVFAEKQPPRVRAGAIEVIESGLRYSEESVALRRLIFSDLYDDIIQSSNLC